MSIARRMRTAAAAAPLGCAALLLLASPALAAAEAPRFDRPRPAPSNLPPNVPPLPPAQFDPSLAIGGEELKARKVETRLTVDVLVNGRGPYHFIVDSGADTSAVGMRIAKGQDLPLGTPAILNGMTARNLVDRVKLDTLTMGPTVVSGLELPALREVDMGGDGMIGIDALKQQRLMLDFDKKLIKVEDARVREPHYPGEIVITARREHGQLILTAVRASDLALDAIIDTGTQVTIGNSALRAKLRHNRTLQTVEMIGVTGETVKIDIAQLDELQLGPVMLHNVPIAFADVPPFKLFGLADQPALLLGTDILEHFRRVSLDFRARKVRFQLRQCQSEGISISTWEDSMTRIGPANGTDVCSKG